MSSSVRILLFMGVASFIAFSIGLNMGLLGFFHREMVTLEPAPQVSGGDVHLLSQNRHVSHTHDKIEEIKLSKPSVEATDSHQLPTPTNPPYIPKSTTTTIRTDVTPSKSLVIGSGESTGPISEYISQGKDIPIALLTCNRVELLEQTIQNLLQVTDVSKDIIIFQDGEVPGVVTVANKYNLKLVQNKNKDKLRNSDGASRIAKHYKFSLTSVFEMRPEAPAVIIIEDDLLFSPDFYQYFLHTAPLLEQDPSTLLISAWNDNGFKGKVQDPYELRRTDYFPGLGWLLTRKLYKTELESKWPQNHWDHWLRSKDIHKGREIIYPQVPRTFHNGIKGTFMNMETHNRYFRDIAYNQDKAVQWSSFTTQVGGPYSYVPKERYEERVVDLIHKCHHVTDTQELMGQPGLFCVWIDLDPEPHGYAPFEVIGGFFGIWHEHRRGAHRNMHEFYWSSPTAAKSASSKSSYILLLNVFGGVETSYSAYKPPGTKILQPRDFRLGNNQMLRGHHH